MGWKIEGMSRHTALSLILTSARGPTAAAGSLSRRTHALASLRYSTAPLRPPPPFHLPPLPAVLRGLSDCVHSAQDRADVKAIVLTGAGGKFCGGADITRFPKLQADSVSGGREKGARPLGRGEAVTRVPERNPRLSLSLALEIGVDRIAHGALCVTSPSLASELRQWPPARPSTD